MRLQRALPALLAAALLIVGAAACGVETNDDAVGPVPTITVPGIDSTTTTREKGSGTGGSTGTLPPKRTTTTEPGRTTTTRPSRPTTTTTTDITGPGIDGFDLRTSLIDTYQKLGLTTEQATCLTDGIVASGGLDPSDPTATPDLDFSKLSDVLVQCNISPNDFDGDLGGD